MTNTHLVDFIESLNAHEINVVEEYIKKMAAPEELQFFRTIVSKEEKNSDEELVGFLAIDKNELRMLKSNLVDKISDALLSDKHLKNKMMFSHYYQMIFTLNKRIILIKVLIQTANQGRDGMLKSLIEETICLAKENEAYGVLADVYKYKKYYIGAQSGKIQNFNKTNEIIAFYDYCYKALFFANDCYYRLILSSASVKSLSKNEFREQLEASIRQMKKDYKKTKSQQINYYLHILKIALYEHEKKYLKAINLCKKLNIVINRSKIVYEERRVGAMLSNLSLYKTFIGKYKEAVRDAQESQKYNIPNSLSYILIKVTEFQAYFYDGEYEQAEKCINTVLKHSINDLGEFRYASYVYYHCCTLFALKKYKEAAAILKIPLEIEKNKSRWNIGVRILKIMLFVELGKIDAASDAVESLRKYMERITKSEEVEARVILIVKLVRELEKNEFVYDPANSVAAKLLKTLAMKNKPVSWEHYTPELIKFHEWVAMLKSEGRVMII